MASFHLIRYPDIGATRYMGLDRPVLRATGGLLFWRLLGTGRGTSMSLGADPRRWALLAVWRDEPALEAFLEHSPIAARWRERASEYWHVRLTPVTSRGHWGGVAPFVPSIPPSPPIRPASSLPLGLLSAREPDLPTDALPRPAAKGPSTPDGPVAVLTRASVRALRLVAFYRSIAAVDRELRESDGCLASLGIGEWPLVRQATFSLWRDATAAGSFAYRGVHHRQVISRVRAENWYAEELFARFIPYASTGTWDGRDPLR
ncbi:spheroidene monooxygenase [Sphaerisporangium album]|uniref:Spheroidene monooxygenase n=1 Tax=Sphaerisporangium album TaxID=509200 RepID=A0A367EXT5_9ACTN|nr:spheroidene monooxygenase [Sphaerisporangium album]RCG22811.1 spheroidene monooxygenase [Sphaerisporangium album]